MGGSDLDPRSAFEPLTKSVQHKQISILKRKTADAGSIHRASELYRELFSSLPRKEEDGVVSDFRAKLEDWKGDLTRWQLMASEPHYPGKDVIDGLLTRCARQLAIRDPFEFIEALNQAGSQWLDDGEDLTEISGFYKNQLPTWRRFLSSMHRFEANREVLNGDGKASAALRELEQIREDATPYSKISRIEPLLTAVDAGNDALVQAQRETTLRTVDQRIDEASKALAQVSASAELSNAALRPLQELKVKIAGSAGIPAIQFLGNSAGDLLEESMELIRASLAKTQAAHSAAAGKTPATGGVSKPTPAAAAPKAAQTIRPAELATSSYLETDAEVDAYLTELKAQCTAVLKAGKRIRIQ